MEAWVLIIRIIFSDGQFMALDVHFAYPDAYNNTICQFLKFQTRKRHTAIGSYIIKIECEYEGIVVNESELDMNPPRPDIHTAQFKYDCTHCRFNWCCGRLCQCFLDLPICPSVQCEVDAEKAQWRLDMKSIPPEEIEADLKILSFT